MIWADVIIFGGIAALCWWGATHPAGIAGGPSRRGERLARRYRMHVAEGDVGEFDALVDAGQRRLFLALTWASVASGAAAIAFDLMPGHHGDSSTLVMLLVFVVLIQLASVLTEIRANDVPGPERTAHVRAARLGSYVSPLLRAYLLLLAMGGAAVVVLESSPRVLVPSQTIALGCTPIALYLVSELGGHVLVRLPESARSTEFLYVRDALRSHYLNWMFVGASLMAANSLSLGLSSLGGDFPFALVVLGGGVGIYWFLEYGHRSMFRRFRRDLWPRLSPEEIFSTAHAGASS